MSVTLSYDPPQGLCSAVRREAWKFLLGYFPWDSTLEDRKVLQRVKT